MISRRQFLQWPALAGAVAFTTSAYAFAIEPLLRLEITRYHLQPPRWPADLKLTIAVVADIHACRPWMAPERIEHIVDETNKLGADLIILLGDYVTAMRLATGYVDAAEWSRILTRLSAPLGVHAILGNHEYWQDATVQRAGEGTTFGQRALEAVGIPVYVNDVVRLEHWGQPFWLAGLGDQVAFLPTRRLRPGRRYGVDDLSGTLAKVTDDAPIILLAHEPDIMVRVPERVSLVLSGHTHGGQLRLFGWSPVVPSQFGNRYAYGHVREQCDLIVSGGLGCSIMPMRFGVPPEIVLVTLGGRAGAENLREPA
jgi:predicted MPP superfamily phosphohydrolase